MANCNVLTAPESFVTSGCLGGVPRGPCAHMVAMNKNRQIRTAQIVGFNIDLIYMQLLQVSGNSKRNAYTMEHITSLRTKTYKH
jgi:hypothetical protein